MRFLRLPRMLATAIFAALLLPVPASAERVLRYTDHEPLGGMRTKFIKDVFFAAVEKESSGRLKISDRWDSAIAAGYDALRVLGNGSVADIGIVVPEYSEAALPLHQIFKSFPAGPTGGRQVAFFRRVYAEIPAFPAELRRNNVVNLFFATGYPVAFFSIKPLKALADIRGDRWRTASFWHRDLLLNAGANPVTIPWGAQVFDALKTQTLDGLMVNVDSGYMLKVHEAAPHVLVSKDLWLGHVYLLAMNGTVWDELAQADKDAIRRAAETAYKALGPVMDDSFAAMAQGMAQEGANVRLLENHEVSAFNAASRYQAVQDAWVQAQQAKGVHDAGPVMENVRAILKEAMR